MNEYQEHRPPERADDLLAWFCAPHLREDIQGDLHELFYLRVARKGLRRARLRYWVDVIRFFRPYVLRRQPRPYQPARGPIMLKNYLKIAFRNLRRQPGYAFINIGGLAVGLAICLLILLYVQDELAFDTFHPEADRIVRIVEAEPSPDQGEVHESYTMGPLGPALVAEMPEVERSVRVAGPWMSGRFTVEHGANRFYSGDHIFAGPDFVNVFHFDWLQGNPETALNRPSTVVLTELAAQRYFGNEDPMGQMLSTEAFGDIEVTGLIQDPPSNTHLDFSMIISFATVENIEGWRNYMANWESGGFVTYLVMSEGADIEALSARLPAFVAAHREASEDMPRPYLQQLTDIHFGSSHITSDINAHKGNIAYLYIFSAVALFILLIACINYMNMATARSMRRSKEVGLRKVVGAHRLQLIRQFLSESMLTAGIGLVLAMGL
ncbi:MAG TPA: permease prefix domain 2-containing transporter, partial [Rhodothermales bacterium]|nr:permease prefix domain 2-containing transporter [Rhodothermales bacterium]